MARVGSARPDVVSARRRSAPATGDRSEVITRRRSDDRRGGARPRRRAKHRRPCRQRGGVEPGEEPRAALEREVREELGVGSDTVRIIGATAAPFSRILTSMVTTSGTWRWHTSAHSMPRRLPSTKTKCSRSSR
ncbi:NUDIX domain-containing protein [Curtobacterium sp. HSID17257]|nr:NUDIX domain-containing protein [Curtobacterium sp. HSID17257]